jgi:hypothetical protein
LIFFFFVNRVTQLWFWVRPLGVECEEHEFVAGIGEDDGSVGDGLGGGEGDEREEEAREEEED